MNNNKLIDLGGTRSRGVIKTENFSVVVPQGTTQTKFMMPDLPNLRNARIFGVETNISNVILTTDSNNNTTIDYLGRDINNIIYPDIVIAENSFVTLIAYNGKEFVKNLPYERLINKNFYYLYRKINNSVVSVVTTQYSNNLFFFGQRVNFPKSYVEINSNSLLAGYSTFAYNFLIYYADDETDTSVATPFGAKI